MASIVERLTENIVERNLLREGAALSKKWERTGLLEGIDSEMTKTTMSRLLENQAKELLREASTMSAGDVEGFAAVAFPIVRRVFGGLIANELVAVQPMSLPSGLIFFLDFNYANNGLLGNSGFNGYTADTQSVYGGGRLASQITGGVSLTGVNAERGFYALTNGYSSATGSKGLAGAGTAVATTAPSAGTYNVAKDAAALSTITASDALIKDYLVYDADELTNTVDSQYAVLRFLTSDFANFDTNNLVTLNFASGSQLSGLTSGAQVLRRLTRIDSVNTNCILVTVKGASTASPLGVVVGSTNTAFLTGTFAIRDSYSTSGLALGAVVADTYFLEGSAGGGQANLINAGGNNEIPEIDIKVDSIAVTAQTKKLKAKWSPELGQDLNAYHNLDAEVELTSILSEHVALEIDQEILNDLVKGATASTKYWSRRPGKFVNRDTGASITSVGAPPDFTGNVSMWYETLIETINDVSAQIHRKTLRGGANFLVTSPEVANILEFTSGFRADVSMEDLKGGSVGAVKAGSLSKKWDLYVDPYFPRNLILVGRRGKAFLESGYVYAPYVPLMITPTIFGTEDFVPRKGLMTRYAKKMVRPDMFGLVVVQDLIG